MYSLSEYCQFRVKVTFSHWKDFRVLYIPHTSSQKMNNYSKPFQLSGKQKGKEKKDTEFNSMFLKSAVKVVHQQNIKYRIQI